MEALRKPLIAGNWKMNAGAADGCTLARAVARATKKLEHVEVVVAPPFTAVAAVAYELAEASDDAIGVAGQNVHHEPSGAYTGEVSASMLKEAGASWVILGHSERRQYFGETDELVVQKLRAALGAELRPIVCVGETLAEREAGQTLEVVGRQVRAVVEELGRKPGYGVLAYEPVWAIGTGKVAASADAEVVHAAIRAILRETSGQLANKTRILYGGSVKADNAESLFAERDIDGALVGGASLDASGFGTIAATAQRVYRAIKAGELPTPVAEAVEAGVPAAEGAPAEGAPVAEAEPAAEGAAAEEAAPATEGAAAEEAAPVAEAEPAEEGAPEAETPPAGDAAPDPDAPPDTVPRGRRRRR
ncbi:MAG: triose-phosphate isomerase [Myxococcales bacterium]|nr:triose-phosphate isomerase [Myxococcales bacterium]